MKAISDLIQLSTAFSAEVKLDRDFKYGIEVHDGKIEGYIPSNASRKILASIIDKLDESTNEKVHLVQASYGKGKSYLLLMLANLLANNRPGILDSFLQKVIDKEGQLDDKLGEKIGQLAGRKDKYLIVVPNYADTDFRHALLQGLITALDAQGIAYRPDTVYRKAAEVLRKWQVDNPALFTAFAARVVTKDIETFIAQLNKLDHPTYEQLRQYFKDVVGNAFSETDASNAYDVFVETARSIRPAYRGIVILYDEFGDMLDKMINKPEGSGLAVQEFLESIKHPTTAGARPNILFVAATHQDPSALAKSQRADITKIIGRFQRHLLGILNSTFVDTDDAAETQEAAELLGTVFLHPEAGRATLAELLTPEYQDDATQQAIKHGLFGQLPDAWVRRQVVKGLFPLHPLTARLLPKISNELAQSNRTMFNFLSPTQLEAGGMQHFLDTQTSHRADGDERPALFTPDRLLNFFETNLAAREKAGESQAGIWLNDYRNAAGRVTGETKAERLFRNLLMLKVVRDNRLAPTADMLFYAQDEPRSQRRDFDSLLETLVTREFLDRDSTNNTYDFPTTGGMTASQAENEEERKLPELTLDECAAVWQDVQRRPDFVVRQFGTDRVLPTHLAHTPADLRPLLAGLTSYYQGKADPTDSRGLALYCLAETPAEETALAHTIVAAALAAPYVLHAYPRDLTALDGLRTKTRPYRVLQKTLARTEIPNPSPLRERLEARLRTAANGLRTAVKEFFEPVQWRWHYGTEAGQEFTATRKFQVWLEQQVTEQFAQMPDVRDDALWFVGRSKNTAKRNEAFVTLYTAPQNLLPLDTPRNALADRILENLLHSLSLQRTTSNKNQVQYCELREPEKDTPEAAIFAHFDRVLKKSDLASAEELLLPLLAAPFGLSEHLVKFFFGLYHRLNPLQLTVYKNRKDLPHTLQSLENLLQNPAQYGQYAVRRIILSGPMSRYLRQLRELFNEQSANSFAAVARQFKGVWQLLTPVQRALVHRRGGKAAEFYAALAEMSPTIGETEAQELFLDTLPNTLLGITSRETFIDDSEHVAKFVQQLRELKELPVKEEKDFERETLRELGQGVFGVSTDNKDELQAAAKAWYDQLASPARLHRYENPRVNMWLGLLRDGPQGQDLTSWYLREIPENPLRDWADGLAGRQLGLVKEFTQHKAEVDAFKRPALPLMQRIARGAFGVINAECASETAFAGLFRNWHEKLSPLAQQHSFADPAVAWLMSNLTSTAPAAQTYLDTIPRRWREQGSLQALLADSWEEWSETAEKAVADKYEHCIGEVNNWRPPIAEANFFQQIGAVFNLPATDTAAQLLAGLQTDWLAHLPERTRQAPWDEQGTDEALLMRYLQQPADSHTFFSQTLPERWKLGQLATMNDATVSRFMEKMAAVRSQVESYRRPLLEVVQKLKRNKTDRFDSPAEYRNLLTNALRDTPAYKHRAEEHDTLTKAPARLLLAQLRTTVPLEKLVAGFATALQLPAEPHFWSKEQQETFVAAWKNAQDALFAW